MFRIGAVRSVDGASLPGCARNKSVASCVPSSPNGETLPPQALGNSCNRILCFARAALARDHSHPRMLNNQPNAQRHRHIATKSCYHIIAHAHISCARLWRDLGIWLRRTSTTPGNHLFFVTKMFCRHSKAHDKPTCTRLTSYSRAPRTHADRPLRGNNRNFGTAPDTHKHTRTSQGATITAQNCSNESE